MKILQIIYSLAPGGAERFVVDISNEINKQGNKVYLCTLRDDEIGNQGFYKADISNQIDYINLKLPIGFQIKNILSLYKLIKNIKPDIVHCHQNLVIYILPLILIFKNIKFYHTIHNDAPTEICNKFEFYIRRFFYRTKKINAITISNETTKSFINFYKTKNYIEIYNGRNIPLPSNNIENVKEYVNKLRTNYNIILLHVARYAYQKNQQTLINVLRKLKEENRSVLLLIIGSGFDTPTGISFQKNSPENIIYLGEKHNVIDYYINTDAFCLTSLHEGMPITLIEALSCGCIPICTPVGGIVDTIKNGITGYISKSISEIDYYHSIIDFLENKNNIDKQYLVEYYNENFSINTCAKKHIKAYRL